MCNNKNKERMRKSFLLLFVSVFGVLIGQQVQGTSTTVNSVLLENVEALADMESSIPTVCWDEGHCTCPNNGKKYGYIYEGFSLRGDEETY